MLLKAGERRRAVERRQLATIFATAQHSPKDIEKATPFAPRDGAMENVGPMADDGPVTHFEDDAWWDSDG